MLFDQKIVKVAPDAFRPVFYDVQIPGQITDEQWYYIARVLETSCSDNQFARKAFDALQFILSQTPPVVSISSLSPDQAPAGSADFQISVSGTGFTSSTKVLAD